LSLVIQAAYSKQIVPQGANLKKKLTIMALQQSSQMMLYGMFYAEKHLWRMTDSVVLLAPTTWMDLPGPSFAEPIMAEIINLKPSFVWGPGWASKRDKICAKPGTE
jgi:hypothetical protein